MAVRAAQLLTKTWSPAVAMMLVSTISYVDRNTLALLSPTILRETHLNNEQYGYIILAFSIAYMLGIRCGDAFWIGLEFDEA